MLMICAFPPPVHGQSLVSLALREKLQADRLPVRAIDIGARGRRGLAYHVTRAVSVARAGVALLGGRYRHVYFSSEAGFGVLYLLLLLPAARLRGLPRTLHHHVYSYIDAPTRLHRLLMRAAGPTCRHLLLSPRMAADFARAYGDALPLAVMRNSITIERSLLDESRSPRAPTRPGRLTIGFIGRLEAAKGFDDFLALVERLVHDERFVFVVAGGGEESEWDRRLDALATRLGHRLDRRGFVGGADKRRFFEDIDLLIFPSRYRNEASPMVCYEALAMAVPVFAVEVGAVRDIVDESCGTVFARSDDLVERMAGRLEALAAEPSGAADLSAGAAERFAELSAAGEAEYRRLCESFAGR